MSEEIKNRYTHFLVKNGVIPEILQGYSFILIVAAIWVAASFLVQEIVSQGLPPFLLAYLCNSMFVLYLPLVEGADVLCNWRAKLTQVWRSMLTPAPRIHGDSESLLQKDDELESVDVLEGGVKLEDGRGVESYTRWQTAKAALAICPVWFLAQFFFNLSLSKTSVTANTILSSLATLFTFLLSVALLSEKFTAKKLSGIALCMLGTALVTSQDGSAKEGGSLNRVWGDTLCVLSALLYACYTIMIKKLLPNDSQVNMGLFFGYIGLFNAVLLAPFVIWMHLTGFVDLWLLSPQALKLTFLKGLFDNVLSDYLWARAVLLVGPTVASAGMGVQVPLAMLVEMIIGKAVWLHHATASCMMLGGGVAILTGFLVVSTQPFS
eukprot:CAMPEP_0196581878 /NCGR_PEP_ID=MMETSP1081-20130531/36181_1 /TAXON_ID=36882 /ORGANISM="Pyramimonas amylifera, Strain CCMP720" /LENGTH=378 /DNA_ID=CAMNT_0041902267 /DNA_START=158 /DNA_END=1294 /DNA_ORIENTATION=+